MVKVRVRQHVNPLSGKYKQELVVPDWTKIYSNLNSPLHLDIGCARGRFLLEMAIINPSFNFLGLEIRETLVTEANQKKDELGLKNLHYLFSNANNSLLVVLASLPLGILQRVTIQFPDPWFKQRHTKRRVVQPELVDILSKYVAEEGIVFLQSDVEAIAIQMCDRFQEHSSFTKNHQGWLVDNPLPVSTEREKFTITKGLPVYRALFTKSSYLNLTNETE